MLCDVNSKVCPGTPGVDITWGVAQASSPCYVEQHHHYNASLCDKGGISLVQKDCGVAIAFQHADQSWAYGFEPSDAMCLNP